MRVGSKKAFEKAVATLAAGEVSPGGDSDHEEIVKALRAFRDKQTDDEIYRAMGEAIATASEVGFHNRQKNRHALMAELTAKAREERVESMGGFTGDAAHAQYRKELALSRGGSRR